MRSVSVRTIRIVLVWNLAFYAMGLAAYAHNQLEHSGRVRRGTDRELCTTRSSEKGETGQTDQPERSGGSTDSHNACFFCQMVTDIRVTTPTAVIVFLLDEGFSSEVVVTDQPYTACALAGKPPARGPPLLPN